VMFTRQTVIRVAPKLLMSCWGSPTWISLFDSNRPEDNVVTKYILNYSMCLYLQNYWDFGLFPLSEVLGSRGYNVLETGFVSVFRLLKSLGLSRCLPFSPEDGNRSSFQNAVSSVT
jgi:hypothetical protein